MLIYHVEEFVCNKAYFKLYPVFNLKQISFFNWKVITGRMQGTAVVQFTAH